jgi:phytoene synthase
MNMIRTLKHIQSGRFVREKSLSDWPFQTAEPYLNLNQLNPQLVEAAFRYSRGVTRKGSKSFYFGAKLLPTAKRRAVWALYTFCRSSDDLVDNAIARQNTAKAYIQLEGWETELRHAFEGQVNPTRPGMAALTQTIDTFKLPSAPMFELLEGMRMDLGQTRYANFEELKQYCYRVASTVGLIITRIIGYSDEAALDYAIDLGIAMQLTNILRDVGEDARNGRIYLPQDELHRFGYCEQELMRGEINTRWISLMKFQVARARQYYRMAWPGIAYLDPRCQLSIAVAARLYSHILDRIEHNQYDVFTRRAYVPTSQKIAHLLKQTWGQNPTFIKQAEEG